MTDPGQTQIILHVDGSNGQFYQQVHNVYVNDNQTASTYHHYTMEAADIEKHQENELIHVIPSVVGAHDSYEYSMLNSMDEHLPTGHPMPSSDHALLHEKEQQRILLESTMSPLCMLR